MTSLAFIVQGATKEDILPITRLAQITTFNNFSVTQQQLRCDVSGDEQCYHFSFPYIKAKKQYMLKFSNYLCDLRIGFDNNGWQFEAVSVYDFGAFSSDVKYSFPLLDEADLDKEVTDFVAVDDDEEYESAEAKPRTATERKTLTRASIIIEGAKEENQWMLRILTQVMELIDVESKVKTVEGYLRLLSALFNTARFSDVIASEYLSDMYGYNIEELFREWSREGVAEYDETFNYLQKMAIQDNKEKAVKLFKENVDFLVLQALQFGSSYREIANIVHAQYVDRFICSSTSGSHVWWRFNKTRWEELKDGLTLLRDILIFKVKPLFSKQNLNNAIKREKDKAKSSLDMDKIDFMIDKSSIICKQLSEPSHKSNILKEAADLFFEQDFVEKLVSKTHLFAFRNKVWNCETLEFEPGNPYHFLSQYADYDMKDRVEEEENIEWWYENFINKVLPPDYYVLDEEYKEYLSDPDATVLGPNVYVGGKLVYKTTKKVYHKNKSLFHTQLDEEVYERVGNKFISLGVNDSECTPVYELRDYYFTIMATALGDGSFLKLYPMVLGGANNAKSVMNFCIMSVFGKYYTDTPKSIILAQTGKHDGPTPGWHQINKCKLTGLIEPAANSRFHDGNVKLLTSGGLDRAEGRDLFMKGSEAKMCNIVPRCLAYTFCNFVPRIDGSDPALRTRIIVLPFTVKFDTKCPYDSDRDRRLHKHWPRDEHFKEKCVPRIPALAHIFVDYYIKFAKMGRTINTMAVPECVKQATEAYFMDNDTIGLFIADCTEEVPEDASDDVALTYKTPAAQLYNVFKGWIADNTNNDRKITKYTFYEMMMKSGFTVVDGQYHGIKITNMIK